MRLVSRVTEQGDVMGLEEQGDVVALEQGDVMGLKQGDVVGLEEQGDVLGLEEQGDVVVLVTHTTEPPPPSQRTDKSREI